MDDKFLKPYSPQETEGSIYKLWEKSGFFNPDICIKRGICQTDAEPFSIVLPPPNVTGNLHMGHAAMLVNEGLPNFIVQKLKERAPLADKVVGVLGMAFKADIDDRRESLAYKLKKVLERQLGDLQTDFGRELQNMGSPLLADINDQVTLESERSFELRIKDRERKLIAKVHDALKKIHDGTYGICESCGESIGVKRLIARPVTSYCINCKSEMEAEERREESLLTTSTEGPIS